MIKDIHPRTAVASLERDFSHGEMKISFPTELVSALVGMSPSFVRSVLGNRSDTVSLSEVFTLLDQDAFAETFVPRSRIPRFLLTKRRMNFEGGSIAIPDEYALVLGCAQSLIPQLPARSVQCVVTSTPY